MKNRAVTFATVGNNLHAPVTSGGAFSHIGGFQASRPSGNTATPTSFSCMGS